VEGGDVTGLLLTTGTESEQPIRREEPAANMEGQKKSDANEVEEEQEEEEEEQEDLISINTEDHEAESFRVKSVCQRL